MHTQREKFAKELCEYITKICETQLSEHQPKNERVFDVLGIGEKDLYMILRKITVALPDYIYLSELPDIYSEVIEHLAREYILFQCQEDINDPHFVTALENFIYEAINNINHNYNYRQ